MTGGLIAFQARCVGFLSLHRCYYWRQTCISNTFRFSIPQKIVRSSSLSLANLYCQLESNHIASIRRFTVFSVWLSFLVYAFGFAPGSFDVDLLNKLIRNPLDSEVNSIFVFLFNGLGVLPALYCSFLLPREKSDPLKAWPFLVVSLFLGFFALGPYLGLRKARYGLVDKTEYQPTLTENRWFRYSLLVFVIVLYWKIFPLPLTGTMPWELSVLVEWDKYVQLFYSNRLVHVSSIDFFILWMFLMEPLYEDMKLRGFFQDNPLLDRCLWIVSWLIPLIGPSIYLCTRPRWTNKE